MNTNELLKILSKNGSITLSNNDSIIKLDANKYQVNSSFYLDSRSGILTLSELREFLKECKTEYSDLSVIVNKSDLDNFEKGYSEYLYHSYIIDKEIENKNLLKDIQYALRIAYKAILDTIRQDQCIACLVKINILLDITYLISKSVLNISLIHVLLDTVILQN